jgi:ribosome recycling factor
MYDEYESKMKKTVEVLQTNFSTVRAGRANPAVLDQIKVDYYGTPTPLNQIASIGTPDPRTLMIQPWDASSLKLIEKAIMTSDLGINPANDGRVIRLVFPQPTEERRKELIRQINKQAEDAKVSIRNIRRDAVETYKAQKKTGEITEDDLISTEKDIQKLTDSYIKDIDAVTQKKEAEIKEI